MKWKCSDKAVENTLAPNFRDKNVQIYIIKQWGGNKFNTLYKIWKF